MDITEPSTMVHCHFCGKQMHHNATACPQCGAAQPSTATSATDKRILPVALW